MNWMDSFFISPTEQHSLVVGTYNYTLVILSIVLASTASFVALHFASMTKYILIKRHHHIAIIAGAFIMAGGVWSMHFVGMLAYDMGDHTSYDITLTIISILPSLIASYITLRILSKPSLTLWQLLISSLSVGAGIGMMHYTGMAAMEMNAELRYVPSWFIASIVVAVVLAFVALSVRYSLSQFSKHLSKNTINAISAIIMGFAIAGMHYTGMTGARFIPLDNQVMNHQISSENMHLSYIVAFFTLMFSAFAATIASQLRYRQLLTEKTTSELRLKTTLETAVDGIITIDENGNIQQFNSAASHIFGWNESEVIGRSFLMLVPDNAVEEYKKYLASFHKTRRTTLTGQAREVFAKHKDGHSFPIRLGVGHVDIQEIGSMFVGFVSDITERWTMQEKLRNSEEQYSSLIKNVPGATFRCLIDENWTAVLVSDGIFQISGWKPADFYQYKIHFSDLIHPDDVEITNQAVSNAIKEKTNYTVEFRWKHKKGHYIWVLENGSIAWDDDLPLWIDGLILDITDRVEMEDDLRLAKEKAELSAESKAQFLANMSHEIRTPMNAIIGFSDILLESDFPVEEKKHLQTISQSARSLLHLLNDVLDSAKLEKNKLELDKTSFEISKLIDTVISTLWLQAKNKGLYLDFHLPPDIHEHVIGDENRIRQVLLNILGNAIKFTEQGGVTLTLTQVTNNRVRFSVQDTGIGIDSQTLENIFEPFSQADASMSRRFGGTGLGTTISKQLVELMGGELHATSEPGKGSVFYFDLPLKKSTLPVRSTLHVSMSIPPQRVLIADDIEQNITLLSLLLKRQHHEVFHAENGLEAFEVYKKVRPDIILMDLQMPKMDGFAASKLIRDYETENDLQATPIIALTASVLQEDRIEAKQSGMDGFSNKPIDINLLTSEMARVLGLTSESQHQEAVEPTIKRKAPLTQINLEMGIHLWGNLSNYLNELHRFDKNYAKYPVELSHLINDADIEQLKYSSHKFNGLCGNLALDVMHQHITTIEQHVRDENMTACVFEVNALKQAFNAFSIELKTLIATYGLADAADTDIALLESGEALKIVDELLTLTSLGELDESKLEMLVNGVPSNLRVAAVAIKDAMTDFDFASANSDLILIRQQMITSETL